MLLNSCRFEKYGIATVDKVSKFLIETSVLLLIVTYCMLIAYDYTGTIF